MSVCAREKRERVSARFVGGAEYASNAIENKFLYVCYACPPTYLVHLPYMYII